MIIIELDNNWIDRKVIEQQYIDSEGSKLNTKRAHTDTDGINEYRLKNAEIRNEKQRNYRIKNIDKEQEREYKRNYNIENADKIKEQKNNTV